MGQPFFTLKHGLFCRTQGNTGDNHFLRSAWIDFFILSDLAVITDGKDGIVIPYHKEGYAAAEAADMLATIMKDENKREQMALAAIERSKEYSVEKIYGEWEKVFHSLLTNN